MKFVVPLTIPWMRSTCAPASDSRSTRTTGTTPATAASNPRCTPRSRASVHSSSPRRESSCLFAVTTWRPPSSARRTYSNAGSTPPISSTTSSERSRISSKSPRERVSTPTISGARPVRRSIAAARSPSRRSNAEPTVPCPSSPIRRALIGGRRAAHAPHAGSAHVPIPRRVHAPAGHTSRECRSSSVSRATTTRASPSRAEDHRRARHAVVVVRHRVAVRARRRRHDDVARARVVEQRLADHDVARLAVLARERDVRGAAEAIGDVGAVARAVEHRPQVVGHAAVDRDPGRDVALDADHAVERDAAVGDERAAGLDQQAAAGDRGARSRRRRARATNSSIGGGC